MDRKIRQVEITLKAMANRRRLAILKFLRSHREASVGEIAEHINLSLSATSRHLAILFKAGLIESEQRSLLVFYELSDTMDNDIRRLIDLL